MTDIVALIPARAGSKGVPNKNLRTLAGKSLLAWSIQACLKVPIIDRVVVSTDSLEYKKHAEEEGAQVPFMRPAEISGDRSTDYEFIRHALDEFELEGKKPRYIVHIRPTTPLRDPLIIQQAIQLLTGSLNYTALRSVHEMPETAYKCFEMVQKGILKRIGADGTELDAANNARQEFPKTFHANGYVDVLSTKFIETNKQIHGGKVLGFVTPLTWEIDTEDDFDFLEWKAAGTSCFMDKVFG